MNTTHERIFILGRQSDSTRILYNYLRPYFQVSVVVENPESKRKFLKRRVRRLGYIEVFGQLLFMVFATPILKYFSKKRKAELLENYRLDISPIAKSDLIECNSVNAKKVRELLRAANPKIILLSGSRIVGKKLLTSVDAKFINIHAGITPTYRGVHGGYWALVEQDEAHCGVTIHYVDEGIDTGNIIEQAIIHPSKQDSFLTYPILQQATALPLLLEVLKKLYQGKEIAIKGYEGKISKLWYHPTIWKYLWLRWSKGVR